MMRRLALVLLFALLATVSDARDDHIRPYVEGLAAAEKGEWGSVVTLMQEAIRHEAAESKSIRTRDGLVPYVPHFWMGVALANQEQWEAALAQLQISEKQGVIQNTTHYARLRSTRSTIESRRASRISSVGLEEARTLADGALQRALAAQASATTAGASRHDDFRQATQRLQEAIASRREGTPEGFQKTAAAATQAAALFTSATEKVRSQPAATQRPSARTPAPTPRAPAKPEPVVIDRVEVDLPDPEREVPRVNTPEPRAEDPTPRARTTPAPPVAEPDRVAPAPVEPATQAGDARAELLRAFRLQAAGKLGESEAILSTLIGADPSRTDALVLRGYGRYLQGVLQREDRLLEAAREDFRLALSIDPGLRLDERHFSPKAVRFFDALR